MKTSRTKLIRDAQEIIRADAQSHRESYVAKDGSWPDREERRQYLRMIKVAKGLESILAEPALDPEVTQRFQAACATIAMDEAAALRALVNMFAEHVGQHGKVYLPMTLQRPASKVASTAQLATSTTFGNRRTRK